MRRLLIGPAMTGIGWLTGSYYGADAEQIVHKSPDSTYESMSDWIDSIGTNGTTSFEGGKPVPYQIQTERSAGQRLTIHILFDGRQGGTADIEFEPQNGGRDTLVKARAHGETGVLSGALAGTSMARMAYAPDWMLNIFTIRPLLHQLADQIEQGQPVSTAEVQPHAQNESALSPEQQRQEQEWQQYDATRPAVDPDADANRYMSGAS